eukprot:TRINITY_DN7535_c4_g1_i2.p1 TRINITY_DN7535_c4_g1~~TRINITY_DN7535_c4_g1_i2.p1  ORF type:complete len:373 (+),score=121.64 TRINITY_DN7535_c4_g1_i2:48-1121(+)
MQAAKKAARREMLAALQALSAEEVSRQSAQVHQWLSAMPEFSAARNVSLYLPMDGGREVDTWPILRQLVDRGSRVFVPRVTGPSRQDMELLRVTSYDEARAFPRSKWGIPEPDEQAAAKMERPDLLDLILVPGVAFDSKCNRLGHGVGFYDTALQLQAAKAAESGKSPPTTVGLALAPQLLPSVPVDAHDVRLSFVVSPEQLLAFASDSSNQKAAEQAAGVAAAEQQPAGSEDAFTSVEDRVDVADGVFKYAALRVTAPSGKSWMMVRSGPGGFHADVADPLVRKLTAAGLGVAALGGGRIQCSHERKRVFIYGFSVGFGGGEGGPPGAGMRDHSETAALVRQRYPGYDVTFSADGY